MPRPPLNSFKNGLTAGESRKSSNRSVKYKKPVTTASSKKSNSNTKDQDRLEGGADVPVGTESAAKEVTQETSNVEETVNETVQNEQITFPTSGPCCSCLSQEPGSTGDKKVDEMIDYVHLNLLEAGKALATLSENFEHESKLMFVDILGRIQQWTNIVQNKLDLCKADIEALRKELMARVCEIANLRKLLSECKEREASEKQVMDTQKSRIVQEETLQQQTTPQTLQQQTTPQTLQQQTTPQTLQQQTTPMQLTRSVQQPKQTDIESVQESQQETDKTEKNVNSLVDEKSTEDKNKNKNKNKDEAPKEGEESSNRKIEIVCTDAAIQSMMKDKDGMRREMELEAEISRLRKENERIIKERAEYENAIQRALLRGVSSLNVEALRVLRCPPIPCCSPCAPCPASVMKSPGACKKDSRPSSRDAHHRSCSRKVSNQEAGSSTVKRPCNSPCCSAGKNRKPESDNSMILLLHRGDTENICNSKNNQVQPVCGSPLMKKIEIPPCPRFI